MMDAKCRISVISKRRRYRFNPYKKDGVLTRKQFGSGLFFSVSSVGKSPFPFDMSVPYYEREGNFHESSDESNPK